MSEIATSPTIERMRLELVRRNITVQSIRPLSPRLLSITFSGDELIGFNSPSPDDHIKIFFATPGGEPQGRDYTPRHFDTAANLLTIEFFLHEGGLGSEWARHASLGDRLQIGGPRGSTVVSAPGAWWLLIGDETALPSVARRLEEMNRGSQVVTLLAVANLDEEQRFTTSAKLSSHWIHRPDTQAADAAPFISALANLDLPEGPGFIWIGAEAEVSKAVRSHFIDTRGTAPEWIKASAYWTHKSEV